jgi:hypothetical protein
MTTYCIRRINLKCSVKSLTPLLLALAVLFSPPAPRAAEYEAPPVLKAKDFLPADILTGSHYEVDPQVESDGYMNYYTIMSDFGTFEARSTAMARIRIREIGGIAQLRELNETEAFTDALAASAKGTVDAAARVVTDPVGTAKGIPEGVGRMFKRMGRAADKVADRAGEAISTQGGEGSAGGVSTEKAVETGKDLAGVNKAKRALAKRVGVDPYSRNPVLQAELERLAWAAFGGGLAVRAAKKSIPFAGQVTKVSGMVWDSSPEDLEVAGREKLAAMGVSEERADGFYEAPHLTVTSRFALVTLLEKMGGVAGRPEVVRLATNLRSVEEAGFFVVSCAMLQRYHESSGPLERILAGHVMPGGVKGDGTLVFALAVDHVVWTEDIARAASRVAGEVRGDSSLEKVEFRALGSLSPRSRRELESLGWTVHERAAGTMGLSP